MLRVVPQLTVDDLARSVAFYTEHFGLKVTHRDPPDEPDLVLLEREDAGLYLTTAAGRSPSGRPGSRSAARGAGVRLYFEVDDAAALHEALAGAGAVIMQPLTTDEAEQYAEFVVADPDGYELAVFS
ncbi:MAG: VOC family protein [Chthonomonadales bacterium]|nr:VOC family protein [Chthonomonadales bacterium]